jgi:uncharacterized protein YoxC
MFEWLFGWKAKRVEQETKKGFNAVKEDISGLIKWVKHLDNKDKQLFDVVNELKDEISSIRDEISGLREGIDLATESQNNKQVFGKKAVWSEQTAVDGVQDNVQTPVQTGNFYEILKSLTRNEKLLIHTLLGAGEGMKLSYEDLALMLGKEKATIRGQINAIKQKSELIEEIVEKNGKKRVFVRPEMREKLSKYAKVRVAKKKKEVENTSL